MGAGQPGATGATGSAGSAGRDGKPGSDGLSITAAIVNTEGNLILTRSDGSAFNAGRARGEDGSLNIEGSNLDSLVDNKAFQTAVTNTMTTTARLNSIATALGNTIKSDNSLRSTFTNQLAETPNFYSTLSKSLDYSKVTSDVAANQVIWCADGSIDTCRIPSMKTGIRFGSDGNNGNLTYNTTGNKFNFTKPVQIGDDSQGGQFQVGQHFGFNSPHSGSGNPIINIGKDDRLAGKGVKWQLENVTGGSLHTSKLVFKRNAANNDASTDNWENSFQITHEGIEIPQNKRLYFGSGHAGGTMPNIPIGNGVHMGIDPGSNTQIQLNAPADKLSYIDFSTSGEDKIGRIIFNNSTRRLRFDNDIETGGQIHATDHINLPKNKHIYFGAGESRIFDNNNLVLQTDDWVEIPSKKLKLGDWEIDSSDGHLRFRHNGDQMYVMHNNSWNDGSLWAKGNFFSNRWNKWM